MKTGFQQRDMGLKLNGDRGGNAAGKRGSGSVERETSEDHIPPNRAQKDDTALPSRQPLY